MPYANRRELGGDRRYPSNLLWAKRLIAICVWVTPALIRWPAPNAIRSD